MVLHVDQAAVRKRGKRGQRKNDLAKLVEFTASPITDIKRPPKVDIALIEGAVCNEENMHVLKDFREKATFLIALGDCAVFGNLP